MTRFVHPEWLAAVVAVASVAGLALAFARWRGQRRRRALLGAAAPGVRRTGPGDAALFAALVAVGVALLGPRFGERSVAVPGGGVDVVFLVDVSRSMDARDVPPSRLARARRAVEALLQRLEAQDRAGLAAFGERGVLLAPLTPDRGALRELLGAFDTGLVHPAGSNLGAGVRAALEAFAAGSDRPRVVFALSDGEDPHARRDLGASDARRAGVRVLAAAIGTEAGATVPDRGTALRDASGSVVMSRRRVARLARLADATGGELLRADAWGELELERAGAAIRRDAGEASGEMTLRTLQVVRVLPFAAIGFVLLLVEALPRPRRRLLGRRAALAVTASLALAAATEGRPKDGDSDLRGLEARLRARPHDARTLLGLGLARLERGRPDAAARAFSAAAVYARDPELSALAYYDLGVARLDGGDLEAARDAFFDALALDPGDGRARFNLEWTLRALAGRAATQEPEPGKRTEPEPSEQKSSDTGLDDSPGVTSVERFRFEPPSREQRRRLLERVNDDPGRALRMAADPLARRSPAGPMW